MDSQIDVGVVVWQWICYRDMQEFGNSDDDMYAYSMANREVRVGRL